MCLQRNVDETAEKGFSFSLESHNFAFAKACEETLECICNTNEEWWPESTDLELFPQLTTEVKLPKPLLVPIETYKELKKTAEKDTEGLEQAEIDEITYKKNILSELSGGHQRANKIVAHEINGVEKLPVFKTNDEVPLITDGCEEKVTCDLHYELDWNFRLRAELTCE